MFRTKLFVVLPTALSFVALEACVSTNVDIPRGHPANPTSPTSPVALAPSLNAAPIAMADGSTGDEPMAMTHHHHGQQPPTETAPMASASASPSGTANTTMHPDKPAAAEVWTCPMHSSVVKNGPGKCPICGMNLVKRPADKGAH
jgi:hypothetical protein